MTNPKENTDLEEQIHSILFEQSLKWPVDSSDVRHNLEQILELVHQARENAVEEYRQQLNKYKPDSLKEQESYGAFGTTSAKEMEYLQAKIEELESKEEA
jgi:histidinol dehydrogenase